MYFLNIHCLNCHQCALPSEHYIASTAAVNPTTDVHGHPQRSHHEHASLWLLTPRLSNYKVHVNPISPWPAWVWSPEVSKAAGSWR